MKNKMINFFLYLFISFHSLSLEGSEEKEQLLIHHVEKCIKMANIGQSNLSARVIKLAGMSSPKTRHLLNNLCTLPNTSYLEIGTWEGSTWISALYKNKKTIAQAVAVDNWSEFGGEDKFNSNCTRYIPEIDFTMYSSDCFQINLENAFTKPVNIYFYDGQHSLEAQEKAFTYYDKVLDDVFIAIVDDWNWDFVREGTKSAFNKLNYEILYEKELPAVWNEEKQSFDLENWWNGLYIAVIKHQQ